MQIIKQFIMLSFTDGYEPLSPGRCLFACLIPVLTVKYGLSRHSLDRTGAVAGEKTCFKSF